MTRFPVSAHHSSLHVQGIILSGPTNPQHLSPKVVQVRGSQSTASVGVEEAVDSLRELRPGNRVRDREGLTILGEEREGRRWRGGEGREGKGREGKGREGKGRGGEGRGGKGREGEGRGGEGREGKGREGKGREGEGRGGGRGE